MLLRTTVGSMAVLTSNLNIRYTIDSFLLKIVKLNSAKTDTKLTSIYDATKVHQTCKKSEYSSRPIWNVLLTLTGLRVQTWPQIHLIINGLLSCLLFRWNTIWYTLHYITIYLYYRLWFSSCHINCGKVWREDSWLHLELTEKVRYKICFWVDRRNYLVTLQVMMSEDALYDDGVVMEAVIEKFVKYFKSIFHHNSWYFASFIFCEYYC